MSVFQNHYELIGFFFHFIVRIRRCWNGSHGNKQNTYESSKPVVPDHIYESTKEGNTDYHELGEFRDESNYDKLL